jgi:hypothetical protein
MSLLTKIQTVQFEPDWSKAPDSAVSAVAHLAWIDEDGYLLPGYEITTFERPVPVISPHPHAAIMAKYAEVATRRGDPWVEFEYKHKANKNWLSFISYPNFNVDYNYRYIGDAK